MRPLLVLVGLLLGFLFIASSCESPSDHKEARPAPTVTVTATPDTVYEEVRITENVVPPSCRRVFRIASQLEKELLKYEEAAGSLSEVHDLTATGIASQDIHKINKATDKFRSYQFDSTESLQNIVKALEALKKENIECKLVQ